MKAQLPPEAPHGSASMMQAYNELREFIIRRQLLDVAGAVVIEKSIITTASGKLVALTLNADLLGAGAPGTGPGACCISGACSTATLDACSAAGGTYLGEGVVCTDTICLGIGYVPGACCHGTACYVTTLYACELSGGVFYGGACNPCISTSSGACCGAPGGCTITLSGDCSSGWAGGGTSCADCVPSEPTGACCQTAGGGCTVTSLGGCGGIYFGDNIGCEFVGTCAAAFCGPTNTYCACHAPQWWVELYGEPPPQCCVGGGWDTCGACWNAAGGFYFCCCCAQGPWGWSCWP